MHNARPGRIGKTGWILLVAALSLAPTCVRAQEAPQALATGAQAPRVGISGPPLRLALRDAILTALAKNRDIEIERANLDFVRGGLLNIRGAFDPVLGVGPSYRSERTPVGSVLAGGPSGLLSQLSSGYNMQLGQVLPWGTRYQVRFDNQRFSTSNVFTQLSPQFTTGAVFSITQPLLRNRTMDEPRRQVRLRLKALDISESQVRQRVMEVVTAVQQAYWDLVFARRDAEVRQEAVSLARTQEAMNRRLVQAGTLAPVEIVAAEAEVQRRQEELFLAVERITRAENALRQLLADSRQSAIWNQEILPTDQEPRSAEIPGLEQAASLALRNRPELEQLRFATEQNGMDLDFFRSQLKPQVDLTASYIRRGLAGEVRAGDNPFSAQNQLLLERVNLLSVAAGLTPLAPLPLGQLPQFLIGGYGQSLAHLFGKDFRSFEVGLVFQLPLRNREAEGNLARGLADARRLAGLRARLEQLIEAEVRNALQSVETARHRGEAARAARIASKEKLDSETRLFAAGETTNFLVLTRQNEYSAARAAEVRALTDLNKAIANLERALGATLQVHNLRIEGLR